MASANIVGYTETALQAGFKATGASFVSVGKEGCNLTSVKPAGFTTMTGTLNIQTLDNAGRTLKTYSYYKGARRPYDVEGWYDGSTLITAENDVMFTAGTGLWISGADGYTITTSGEVLMDKVVCNLATGFKMLVNPYPVSIKLSQIQAAGFTTMTGALNIQTLDNAGRTLKTYSYYKGARRPYDVEGWYDGSTLITAENDVTFPIGQGFWVAGDAGYTLTFNYPAE